MNKRMTCLWFIVGLGSSLQIVASLSITECIVLFSTPFIFLKDYQQMRRDGVMLFFWVSILVIVGCIVGCIANKTFFIGVVRGLATTTLIACSIVFSHWLIRKDPNGFKWMFVGGALSSVISTFIFQKAVDLVQFDGDIDLMMAGPLYWIQRLGVFVTLPTRGWYIHMPFVVNITAPMFMAIFSMLTSTSGRSAALTSIAFVAIIIIGGQTRRTMMRLSKNFWLITCLGIVGIFAMHRGYKYAATHGMLGEDARKKYEIQSNGENSLGRLVLGGRSQAFIGLLACRDKPIIGWGPWAMDTKGYREEFMMKYGTLEDVMEMQRSQRWLASQGIIKENLISCHAHITEFWLWYGIFGLLFWIYVIFVFLRYLRQDCFAVPQWFAWLACSIPGMFWAIFFSPFASRLGTSMFVVACLMARAVRQGKFHLPEEMIVEIEKVERGK